MLDVWALNVFLIPKPPLHPKLRLRRRSIRAHTILDRHHAGRVLTQRRVNQSVFIAHMTVNNRHVFFFHHARFPQSPQFARHRRSFSHHGHAAGFAVQPVRQMRLAARAQMQPHAADQAGICVALRRMTDEVRRFVDHQQLASS